MKRQETLEKAIECVCRNREQEYGSPENNFKSIADVWNWYLGTEITAKQVTVMMALLKVARIKTGTFTEDSYIDLAGYAACAGELAEMEK